MTNAFSLDIFFKAIVQHNAPFNSRKYIHSVTRIIQSKRVRPQNNLFFLIKNKFKIQSMLLALFRFFFLTNFQVFFMGIFNKIEMIRGGKTERN